MKTCICFESELNVGKNKNNTETIVLSYQNNNVLRKEKHDLFFPLKAFLGDSGIVVRGKLLNKNDLNKNGQIEKESVKNNTTNNAEIVFALNKDVVKMLNKSISIYQDRKEKINIWILSFGDNNEPLIENLVELESI